MQENILGRYMIMTRESQLCKQFSLHISKFTTKDDINRHNEKISLQ